MNLKGLFRKKDSEYFIGIGFILIFLLLVFDRDMSMIYLLILLVDQWLYSSDNNVTFRYSKDNNIVRGLVSATIGLAAFLGISTLLASQGLQSILGLLATATPVLKDSRILTFIGWGILIPIIETNFFFGSLLEGLPEIMSDKAGMNFAGITDKGRSFFQKITKPGTIFIILLVSACFTLFHISAKGLENSIPLIITFMFAIISCVLVIKDSERRGAVYMHIAVNSLTVLTTYGLI